MMLGSVLGIISAYPIFWMVQQGSTALLFAAMIIGMPVVQAAIYGPSAAFISEMFATRIRYSGASAGYQLASTLGGGFSPLIAATLAASGGFPPVTVYIMATFAVSLFIVWLAKEGTRIDVDDVHPAAA
jgi:hypothetical protein